MLADLVSKMNEDKKKDRKNSLILGAAAVSAVTVFWDNSYHSNQKSQFQIIFGADITFNEN